MNKFWKPYDQIRAWFDDNRNKELIEKEYLELALQHIPNGGSILDMGCGTGEPLAKFFIHQGFHVTGIDESSQMIALCKDRFPEMEWITEDMRSIDLNKKFNMIIAWNSLFHLNPNDQRKMFPIFSQHLHIGSILLFTSGPKCGEVYSNMSGHEFYHASLSLEEYRDLLRDYGFEVLLNRVEDSACGMHTVWLAKKVKDLESA